MGRKLGVFGGTFNPIHNGHLNIAEGFHKKLGLDEILMIPDNSPPHKSGDGILPGAVRLEMCRLAVEKIDYIKPIDIELQRNGKSYTVDTLRELRTRFPEDRLYLIMGEDMFLTINQWLNYKKIIEYADLCTTMRQSGKMQKLIDFAGFLSNNYGARCHVEDIPVFECSSTEIRDEIRKGNIPEGLVPQKVITYIYQNNLYQI